MRRVAAILVFLVLAVRAAVPALPMYVCAGMGAAHLWHPCCAGAEEAARPLWTASCCRPEPGAAVEAALPPAKPGLLVPQPAALTTPVVMLLELPRVPLGRLLPARAPPWPVGPPPPLRAILRI